MGSNSVQVAQFDQRLEGLRQSYLDRLRDHLGEISTLLQRLISGEPAEDLQQRILAISHNFAGSGATFGFGEISKAALHLNRCVKEQLRDHTAVTLEDIANSLKLFEAACQQALGRPLGELANTRRFVERSPRPGLDKKANDIYFIGRDGSAAEAMAEVMGRLGYQVVVNADSEQLGEAAAAMQVKAVLLFGEISTATMTLLDSINSVFDKDEKKLLAIPLIVISPDVSFATRLAAVRAGASGFFAQDVDPIVVIDKIEQLNVKFNTRHDYNVLIVDDDELASEMYSQNLKRSGMNVITLDTPERVLATLMESRVDLLILDYAMPGCNGKELAAVLRHDDKYLTLPIIFISSDADIEKSLFDSGLGIDDFLIKPFTPAQLESLVVSRARRAADLKPLLLKDSLSGLLNHASFTDELDKEALRVQRLGHESAYISLDIDYFKRINDVYGHVAGDDVIKGLSRVLQQSLRREDILGRCGGEEFGIIMPCTPLADAKRTLERLRLIVAETAYNIGGESVRVTFSAGIAPIQAESEQTIDQLLKTTDEALYAAKAQGRNRVVGVGSVQRWGQLAS